MATSNHFFLILLKTCYTSVVIFFLVLTCTSSGYAGKSMTIVYPDYWPFFSRAGNGTMQGIFYEIITKAIQQNSEIEIKWEEYPWKRCQQYVKHGKADAMITVPTKRRLEYSITHPSPFYNKTMNIFTYAAHPKMDIINSIKNIEELAASDLTVITYAGNGWNDKHIRSKGIPIHEGHLRTGIWGMLAYKRGDIIIEWPDGAWPDIEKLALSDKIIQTNVVLESMPFHLLISKKSPYANLLKNFDQTIYEMRKDKTLQKIIDKYSYSLPHH